MKQLTSLRPMNDIKKQKKSTNFGDHSWAHGWDMADILDKLFNSHVHKFWEFFCEGLLIRNQTKKETAGIQNSDALSIILSLAVDIRTWQKECKSCPTPTCGTRTWEAIGDMQSTPLLPPQHTTHAHTCKWFTNLIWIMINYKVRQETVWEVWSAASISCRWSLQTLPLAANKWWPL